MLKSGGFVLTPLIDQASVLRPARPTSLVALKSDANEAVASALSRLLDV